MNKKRNLESLQKDAEKRQKEFEKKVHYSVHLESKLPKAFWLRTLIIMVIYRL